MNMFLFPRYINLWRNSSNLSLRMYSNKVKGCWKCSHTDIKNTFFCASCGVLRDVSSNEDYFNLLNLTKQFNVDQTKLTRNFRQAQNVIHPDKFSQKSAEEKALALEWSSLVNKAYKTLSKSIDRGKYILELNGIAISEDNSTIDKEFLLKMMEVNESVDDAETIDELQQLSNNISADINELNEKLAQVFSTTDMDAAKQIIIRLKYLLNIEATIKEKKLRLKLKS